MADFPNITCGDNIIFSFTLEIDNELQDLRDGTLYFTLKDNLLDDDEDADLLYELEISSPVAIYSQLVNINNTYTSPLLEKGLLNKEYYHELRFKDASGNIYTVDKGQLNVTYNVRNVCD